MKGNAIDRDILSFKKILFAFIFIFFICVGFLNANKPSEPSYCKCVDDLNKLFLQDVYQTYNLKCRGTGGKFLKDIEQIFIALQSDETNFNLDTSRILYINCAEKLLKYINQDKQIRAYLKHYPFIHNDIHLTISFINKKEIKSENFISYITNINGNIYYSYYDPNEDVLKTLHKECFENALKIVENQTIDRKF